MSYDHLRGREGGVADKTWTQVTSAIRPRLWDFLFGFNKPRQAGEQAERSAALNTNADCASWSRSTSRSRSRRLLRAKTSPDPKAISQADQSRGKPNGAAQDQTRHKHVFTSRTKAPQNEKIKGRKTHTAINIRPDVVRGGAKGVFGKGFG